jgi:predicted nucleotidyltransferase
MSSLSVAHPRRQHQPVHMDEPQAPTFVDMRHRMENAWLQSPGCQELIQWAGIFGSIARGRAGDRDKSDVDVLVVMKDHNRCGQPIDLHEGVFSPIFNLQLIITSRTSIVDLKSVCGRDVSLLIGHGVTSVSMLYLQVALCTAMLQTLRTFGVMH